MKGELECDWKNSLVQVQAEEEGVEKQKRRRMWITERDCGGGNRCARILTVFAFASVHSLTITPTSMCCPIPNLSNNMNSSSNGLNGMEMCTLTELNNVIIISFNNTIIIEIRTINKHTT